MKKPITPNSMITSMLRRLWLYSRERRERLRLDGSVCWTCKSKIKPCVHHIDPVNMKRIIAVIREELLVGPDKLATYCKLCHDDVHKKPIKGPEMPQD